MRYYLIGFVGPVGPSLVRYYSGEVHYVLRATRIVWARMRPVDAGRLACRSEIKYVEPDSPVLPLEEPQIFPWGVRRVFCDRAHLRKTWEMTRGREATVAVLDTGIDVQHPCLRVRGGVNVLVDEDPEDFTDRQGHGTWVAGIAAALDEGSGVVGVAPEAELYSVKVLDDRGRGSRISRNDVSGCIIEHQPLSFS